MPHSVLIIDPNEIVRVGALAACQRCALSILGEVSSIHQAIRSYRHGGPDVILVDPDFSVQGGFDRLRQLRRVFPEAGILVWSDVLTDSDRSLLHAQGFSGQLRKNISSSSLVNAVQAFAVGSRVDQLRSPLDAPTKTDGIDDVPTGVGRHSVDYRANEKQTRCRCMVPSGRPFETFTVSPGAEASQATKIRIDGPCDSILSVREKEVLSYLSDGMTNKEIARMLHLSVKTIETYRSRLMKKLNLKGRSALTRFAREHLLGVMQ
ncbi:MAG: response regulator transcription factor [Planctomycetota bacterium]